MKGNPEGATTPVSRAAFTTGVECFDKDGAGNWLVGEDMSRESQRGLSKGNIRLACAFEPAALRAPDPIGGHAMEKFTTLTGVAAPLPMMNVDTDMIIPKQFLKTIKRTGLGKHLFHEMRYDHEGREIEDFLLHKPAYREAKILVAGENFGCGSSREHAPWALLDFGIRCVIAPSFADIFYNNCFKNGILPIVLPQEDVDKLMDDAHRGANAVITVDLENQVISGPDGGSIGFEIDAHRKHCLLNGLDDIGLTLEKGAHIDRFEARHHVEKPWLTAG